MARDLLASAPRDLLEERRPRDLLSVQPVGDGGLGLAQPEGFAGTGVPLDQVESVTEESAKARAEIPSALLAGAVRIANTPRT